MNLIAASTQFDLKPVAEPQEFWNRVERLITGAVRAGAKVMQFPEYFSLSWLLALNERKFDLALDGFAAVAEEFHQRFAEFSKTHDLAIVSGTVPFLLKGKRVNRAYIYLPDGRRLHQDKQNMTRFESEEWAVAPGEARHAVFEWQGARWGVAICYDVEFPEYVRALVEQNVDVILVPSCTDDVHGYWRVRHCSEARAVESQSYVIMSSIVGGDPRHPEINIHYGAAGFFTPCDVGFKEGGVLMVGDLNQENVHVCALDMDALRRVRVNGTVLNRRDSTK